MQDIPLEEITEGFGNDYKTFLLKDLGCSTDKMNKCLCWLNRLLYLAVDREIIRANPIEDVEYEKKNPPKLKHISRNELKRLMATPFEDSNMELARRMFIFRVSAVWRMWIYTGSIRTISGRLRTAGNISAKER